jgi:release factor glutamine methyltransferase
VLGISRKQLRTDIPINSQLDLAQQEQFDSLCRDREAGQPLQYVLGVAPFRYIELFVGPGVLIPRPETEVLIDIALQFILANQRITSVIDLGAGSGAISIALFAEAALKARDLQITAVENSTRAINYLQKNISKYEVPIRVVNEDVAVALIDVKADLVVANPPYVPDSEKLNAEVDKYEPKIALRGGSDGTEIPALFFKNAVRMLKPDGVFIMEHHESHADKIAQMFSHAFKEVQGYKDLNGKDRFTSGILKNK